VTDDGMLAVAGVRYDFLYGCEKETPQTVGVYAFAGFCIIEPIEVECARAHDRRRLGGVARDPQLCESLLYEHLNTAQRGAPSAT
jgi:hypothetical protein